LASGADDAAQGAAAGEAAHDAASKAGPPPVSRNIQDRADGPGPKPIIKATPKTPVSPKTATAPGPPKKAPTVEEPQPIHDPTKTGEVEPWQTKQLDPDFDASMRETSARLRAAEAAGGGRNNAEQSALIEMAKSDKKAGVTPADAQAYRDLGKESGVPVRGPETHPKRPYGREPHIHVGPVDHIPVKPGKP